MSQQVALKTEPDSDLKPDQHFRGCSSTSHINEGKARTEELSTLPQTASASSRRQAQTKFFANPQRQITVKRENQHFYESLLEAGHQALIKQASSLGLVEKDNLINITPIDRPIGGPFYKRELSKFVDGQISAEELIQCLNYPRLQSKSEDFQLKTLKNVTIMGNAYKLKTLANNFPKNQSNRRVGFFVNEQAEQMAKDLLHDQRKKEQQEEEEKQEREMKKQILKEKLNKLKRLINGRIAQRRSLNHRGGKDSELQAVQFLKSCLDVNDDIHQTIVEKQQKPNEVQYFEKKLPSSKKLKTVRLNYEDTGTLNHNLPYGPITLREDTQSTKAALKSTMLKNAQTYLEEIEAKKLAHREKLNRIVRLNIEIQNSNARREYVIKNKVPPKHADSASGAAFQMFHKASKTDVKNPSGIITYQDILLYDYIYNPPDSNVLRLEQNPQYVQNLIQSDMDQAQDKAVQKFIGWRKTIRTKFLIEINKKLQKKCKTSHVNFRSSKETDPDHKFQSDSNDSSLRSIYEVNLDQVYTQTHELKAKVAEPSHGFVKRVKQIIKLEELSKKAVLLNVNKLQEKVKK